MTASKQSPGEVWEVFVQEKVGEPHKHAGNVHAYDAEMALQNARDVFARRGTPISMWVVPLTAIRASAPSDKASFFDPADDKIYRLPQAYAGTADERKKP